MNVGDHVEVQFGGRVAKKDSSSHVVRGEWISFKKGEIGRIIYRRPVGTQWLYKVSLRGGEVEFYGHHLKTMNDSELDIGREAMRRVGANRVISKRDRDVSRNADY